MLRKASAELVNEIYVSVRNEVNFFRLILKDKMAKSFAMINNILLKEVYR
jgi:hypothetical protein